MFKAIRTRTQTQDSPAAREDFRILNGTMCQPIDSGELVFSFSSSSTPSQESCWRSDKYLWPKVRPAVPKDRSMWRVDSIRRWRAYNVKRGAKPPHQTSSFSIAMPRKSALECGQHCAIMALGYVLVLTLLLTIKQYFAVTNQVSVLVLPYQHVASDVTEYATTEDNSSLDNFGQGIVDKLWFTPFERTRGIWKPYIHIVTCPSRIAPPLRLRPRATF